MDMIGRDRGVTELQVTGRTGIPRDDHLESEIGGGSGGGIHAHVGHHATDDHALDFPILKKFQ